MTLFNGGKFEYEGMDVTQIGRAVASILSPQNLGETKNEFICKHILGLSPFFSDMILSCGVLVLKQPKGKCSSPVIFVSSNVDSENFYRCQLIHGDTNPGPRSSREGNGW